ncbi:MAG: PAS domain S-box protein [Acidimicrobiales bacterium]
MNDPAAVVRGGGQPQPLSRDIVSVLGEMVAMAVVDLEGALSYVSERWCALSGWSADEVLGSHWAQIVHQDDLPAARRAGREAVERGEAISYESRIVSRDKAKVTWIQSTVTPLLDAAGVRTGWLLVAHDLNDHKMAAEALAQSERRLQVIFDSSSDVITILEPDGTRRATSASAQQLFGYPAGWIPEKAPWNVIHPDDLADAQRALHEFVAQETHAFGKPYEFRVITAQGAVKWVETTGVNLVDDPAVRGIVLHTRDVTEQHEAAEQLRAMAGRLGSLVAHLPVGVMLADEKGRITYVNRAAAELLRLDGEPDELVRAGPKAMWHQMRARHPDFEEHLLRAQEIIGERRSVLDERVVVHDGRTLSRSHVPIVDGTVYRGFLWIFQDLTEQVTMVAEREHLLEVEQRQNIRLRELDSLKSDLVASVSHELRTPLTSIMSFTKLLLDGLGVDTVTDQAEFIGVIGRNTERILRLVDDLLLLDRLESDTPPVEPESVDFARLVAMAVSSIQPLADESGIELVWQVTGGPPVKGDDGRLAQVVDNLLANAVKFTPSGGEVRVEACPEDGHWKLEVSDTGIGIPVDEVPELFQRFYRASNARIQAVPGSGLGLAIVRRVVELHGGTIDVSSAEGKGTTVTVTLPGIETPAPPVRRLSWVD